MMYPDSNKILIYFKVKFKWTNDAIINLYLQKENMENFYYKIFIFQRFFFFF